jgi:hypothetical protein
MAHPTWLAYGFAVLMVSVSLYCVGRLALARRLDRRNHYDVNLGHVLMGFAMVGMLVPRYNVIPNGYWEVAFAVLALWFLAKSIQAVGRSGVSASDHDHSFSHYSIHMVMSCAMLYMYWLGMPITARSGTSTMMSGPPVGAGDPSLTFLLIAVLFASAVWQLDGIGRFSPRRELVASAAGAGFPDGTVALPGNDARLLLAPRLEIGCHVAMCLTMGYMLVLMV